MKAAVCSKDIQIRDVRKPAPKDNQVLVRIHATTICAADYRVRKARFDLFTPWKLTILGMELAGTVESVGKTVTRFHAGDQVFGGTGFSMRAHAEYACIPESRLELKPANMTLEES